jgi:hypothetical protein
MICFGNSAKSVSTCKLNRVFDMSAFRLHIWDIPGQISVRRPEILAGFALFSFSPSKQIPRYSLKLGHGHFLSYLFQFIIHYNPDKRQTVALLVNAPCYKPEGHGFGSRWDHLIFSWPNSSTQGLTKMSTRNLPGSKGRPTRKSDNLTAICEPRV